MRDKKLAAITRVEVRELRERLHKKHGQVTANRVTQLLRRVVNFAITTERYEGENPAKLKRLRETSRTRYLQPDELPRLFAALQKEPNRDLSDFVLLALWTGARKADLLSMRWQDISLADNRWDVPNPKNQEGYSVALTQEATKILKARQARANGSPFVFSSRGVTGHLVDLKCAWKKLLTRAKITGLTQHDLRRTLGSYQAAQGSSLLVIGKSLGHRDLAATQIYSRLDLDPVRASVESAVKTMRAMGEPKRLKEGRHA